MSETIAQRVRDFKDNVASKAPAEIGGVFTAEQRQLTIDTDRDALVTTGDVLADFSLPDATGNTVTLGQLIGDTGVAVLVFYRGAWCPYCDIMLNTYRAELLPALDARGVPMAVISPQLPDGSLSVKQKYELPFAVLSDVGNDVARPLGIVWTPTEDVKHAQRSIGIDLATLNGSSAPELPMPTVLVVDDEHVVRWADVRPDYTERAEVPDIVDAVDAALEARA